MERFFPKFTMFAAMAFVLTFSLNAANKDILKSLEDNDMQDFKKLISADEKINAKDENGKTLLHYAAWFDRPEMAEYLLVRGAKIDAKDVKGDTPLTLAASKNLKKMCDFLISKGANEKTENSFGEDYLEILKKFDSNAKDFNTLRVTEKDVAAQNAAISATYAAEAKRLDQSGKIVNADGYYLLAGDYINKTRNRTLKFDTDPETGKERFTITQQQEDGFADKISGTYELDGDCIYMHAKNQNDLKLKVMKSNLLFEPRTGTYYSLEVPVQATPASVPAVIPAPNNNATPVPAPAVIHQPPTQTNGNTTTNAVPPVSGSAPLNGSK